MPDDAVLERLEAQFDGVSDAVVAFSGGADSSLVLAVAARALGPAHVTAVTATSPTYLDEELAAATAVAASLGVEHVVVATQRVRRLALRRELARALLLLQGRAAGRAGRGRRAARRRGARGRRQRRRRRRPPARHARRRRARRAPAAAGRRDRQGRGPAAGASARPVHLGRAAAGLPRFARPLRPADHAGQARRRGRGREGAARARLSPVPRPPPRRRGERSRWSRTSSSGRSRCARSSRRESTPPGSPT